MKGWNQYQRNMVFIIILIATTLSFTSAYPVSALQSTDVVLDPVTIEIVMDSDGTAILSLKATCSNVGGAGISDIPFRIESTDLSLLTSVVSNTEENANLEVLERYSIVTLQLFDSLNPGEEIDVMIRLQLNDIQTDVGSSLSGDIHYVDSIFYVRPLSIYQNFTLTTYLPEQATLSEESVSPIFPTSSGNFTDGQSLVFTWYTEEILPGQERVFIVRYQMMDTSIMVTGLFGLQLAILLVAILGIGIVLGYTGPRIIDRIRKIGRVRFVGVTSEEEEVIDIIRSKGGSCSQKELYSQLDMSQSKVSLVLTALEERGLVRRFKDGRENTVHIIEE